MKNMMDWKFARMRKGIKLRQVAKKVGCSISYISKIENGDLKKINPIWEQEYKNFIQNY